MKDVECNVEIEFGYRGDADEVIDGLHDLYAGMSPAISWSARGGRLTVTVTLRAASIPHAVNIVSGMSVVSRLPIVSVLGMTTKEFDRRVDHPDVTLPPMMSPGEAAAYLGMSPQAVHQKIAAGTIPATRVGRAWVIAAASIHNYKAGAVDDGAEVAETV